MNRSFVDKFVDKFFVFVCYGIPKTYTFATKFKGAVVGLPPLNAPHFKSFIMEKLIVKKENYSETQIMDEARSLIENGVYIFEIFNNDTLCLGVNAYDDESYGTLSTNEFPNQWGVYNDLHPNMWDNFKKMMEDC